MPRYDFKCDNCGHVFELDQPLTQAEITAVCRCGSVEVKKVPSAPAFILKGDGWTPKAGPRGGNG